MIDRYKHVTLPGSKTVHAAVTIRSGPICHKHTTRREYGETALPVNCPNCLMMQGESPEQKAAAESAQAHALLDEYKIPRSDDRGKVYSLTTRIAYLYGKYEAAMFLANN